MKNIERPEVLSICDWQELYSMMHKEKYKGKKDSDCFHFNDTINWLNEEYVEPHKWEQWELEAMKNVDKSFMFMNKQITGYVYFYEDKNSIPKYTPINFVNLKIGETINIDSELERNGMHR